MEAQNRKQICRRGPRKGSEACPQNKQGCVADTGGSVSAASTSKESWAHGGTMGSTACSGMPQRRVSSGCPCFLHTSTSMQNLHSSPDSRLHPPVCSPLGQACPLITPTLWYPRSRPAHSFYSTYLLICPAYVATSLSCSSL